jgi:hypothetical protein
MAQAVCSIALELQRVVPSGAEQEIWPSSANTLMMWQLCWAFQGERGSGERAGVMLEVLEGSWTVVWGSGGSRVVPSSARRVLTNASARNRVVPFAGL